MFFNFCSMTIDYLQASSFHGLDKPTTVKPILGSAGSPSSIRTAVI